MRVEDLYDKSFPLHKSIHIDELEGIEIGLMMPRMAMRDCNRLMVSLILGRNIRVCLEAGASADGITEAVPFVTPLVWNALVNMDEWEVQKKNVETMLMYPIDCNMRGMCGFNLLHYYIVEGMCRGEEGVKKLVWWIGHPMVDVNAAILNVTETSIEILHPSQWIEKLSHRFKEDNRTRVVSVLVEKGMSIAYLSEEARSNIDPGIGQRRRIVRWDGAEASDKETLLAARTRHYAEKGSREMPTPEMNHLIEVPPRHCLEYQMFAFHASYLDVILKTHRLPFSGEEIDREKLQEWVHITDIGREEYDLDDPDDLCQRKYVDAEQIAMEQIHDWLVLFFPYTRWSDLYGLSDRFYAYLHSEMNRGDFCFPSFHTKEGTVTNTSAKNIFMRACYEAVKEGFIFSNRIEELVSRIRLFRGINDHNFHNIESLRAISDVERYASPMHAFHEETEYSLFQIFYMLRRMSRFLAQIDHSSISS
jgi:hypothetical protein